MRSLRLDKLALGRKKRLRYQWIAPFHRLAETQEEFKAVVREIWFSRISPRHSREYILGLWDRIKKEVPFMRDSIEATLEASPFDCYAQVIGFVESLSGRNRVAKVLARGSLSKHGLSVDQMIRYNISSVTHYQRRGQQTSGLDTLFQELSLAGNLSAGYSAVLRDQMDSLGDRMKAWYELLSRLEDGGDADGCLALMESDILACCMQVPEREWKEGLTGSDRLDKQANLLRLMKGDLTLDEAFKKSGFSIWINPESLDGGRYDGDYNVIKKRNGVVFQLVKDESGRMIISPHTYHAVAEAAKARDSDKFVFEEVVIPQLKFTRIVEHKGSWLMKFDGQEITAYVSLPNVQHSINHSTRIFPQSVAISHWLTRRKVRKNFLELCLADWKKQTPVGALVRSMMEYVSDTLGVSKPLIQMSERVARAERRIHRSSKPEDAALLAAQVMAITDIFEDVTFEEKYANLDLDFEALAEGNLMDEGLGLASFAVESSIATWEMNPALQGAARALNALTMMPRQYLNGPLLELLLWTREKRGLPNADDVEEELEEWF
jgi:hypothetical protein